MKVKLLLHLGVLVLVVGALSGCENAGGAQSNANVEGLQNQITQLIQQVQTLQDELNNANTDINQLQAQSGTGGAGGDGASMRLGFVNAEEVFVKFQGTEDAIQAYRSEKEAREKELRDLQEQFSAGAISQNEFLTNRTDLETKLAELDQELTNGITQKIVEAVESLGSDLHYDLITVRKNVVLYYREGMVTDLTERVLEYMNEEHSIIPDE